MSSKLLVLYLLMVICLAFMVNCVTGNLYQELPGSYFLYQTSTDQIFIQKRIHDGGGVLYPTSGDQKPIHIPADPRIPPKIMELFFNSEVIIAKQKKMPYQEHDFRITEGDHAYWILKIKKEELIGPLSTQEYLEYQETLKFSESIKLIPIDSFRK